MKILACKIFDFSWNFKPKMKLTKAFLRKMILGSIFCKIDHFIRIRGQKWIWRPVEPDNGPDVPLGYLEIRVFFKFLEFQNALFWLELHI